MTDTPEQLADKQAIRDLIYTYCRAVDRLDIPLGHSIWHEDGFADYGDDHYQGSGRGVIAMICEKHLQLTSHQHQVSNILIQLHGMRAGSESYVHGTMRTLRDGKTMHISVWARYLDTWEKRDGRWGLLHRTVSMDHTEMREVTPISHHGTPPRRDQQDVSYSVMRGEELA